MSDRVIENVIHERWATMLPRAPHQRGMVGEADAELIPDGTGRLLALTVDTIAEEIAFGLYRSPRTAGRLAATASLADLAAVGADPVGLLMSVTLPASDKEWVQEQVGLGIAEVCARARTFVLGGDTNAGPALAICSMGVGWVPNGEALMRNGAKPGDWLFASGPLGLGSALAASIMFDLSGTGVDETEFAPPLRLNEGRALRGVASCCIDTSDGLIAAMDQLARVSGVQLRLDEPPSSLLHPEALRITEHLRLPPVVFLASATGEYELLFSVPPARLEALDEVAAQLGWHPVRVGWVEAGQGLMIKERPLDGTKIRNLFDEVAGDMRMYLEGLLRLVGPDRADVCH